MTIYVETPLNFNEIEEYVVMEKKQIVQDIVMADKCWFYNVCSFCNHADMFFSEYLCKYIKENNGVVVMIRSVLMELASRSGFLDKKYVAYIKKMYEEGMKVLLIYEEDIFDVLSQCFGSNAMINGFLAEAVENVKRPVSTIRDTLKKEKELRMTIAAENNMDGTLFRLFFQSVRNNKKSWDRLEDELTAVCVQLLANMPDSRNSKYIVLADDAVALGLFGKAFRNTRYYEKTYTIPVMTTPKLAQIMYGEGIIYSGFQVEEILSAAAVEGILRILAMEEYDMKVKEKVMTCGELAGKIMSPGAIEVRC